MTRSTPWALSRRINSSIDRVECPIVRTRGGDIVLSATFRPDARMAWGFNGVRVGWSKPASKNATTRCGAHQRWIARPSSLPRI